MSNVGSPGVTMAPGTVPGLTATSYFNPASAGYSSSVQICVVEVDPGTGEIEILDWVVGHDCGRVINPLLVEGQVLGGVAHGLSNAMYEESLYSDDGIPLTTSFLDYPIPSARELPTIGLYDQETRSPLNPLGVKGAGEAGTLGVPAVIASAVEDALRPLGVRLQSMPLSPGLLGDLIFEAGTAATPASA
jgi:aerobic carbon-monoxide dehydrogenase large subunit